MLSNHNRNNSSFRIIEPKQQSPPIFQQAQHTPVHLMQQQIPILSMSNNNHQQQQINLQQSMFTRNSPFNNSSGVYFNNNSRSSSQNAQYLNNSYNINTNQHIMQKNNSRARNLSDTDSSYIPETTSESGISDLDMSEKCTCCPYGYHIDTDFVTFLHDLGGKNLNKQLKKIQRKRNDKLQRSMEYVIDEVEKLRQLNEENGYLGERADYTSSPLNQNNFSLNQSSNIYSQSITPTNSVSQQRQQIGVPSSLKKTINKIDKLTNETNELFNTTETARRLLKERNCKSVMSGTGSPMSMHNGSVPNSKHHSSNNYLNLGNNFTSSSSLPQQQKNLLNTVHNLQQQHKAHCTFDQPQSHIPVKKIIPPRRSFSSCAEPIRNQNTQNNMIQSSIISRRCSSNRSSPIRQIHTPQVHHQFVYQSNPKLSNNYTERTVRSRSHSRRSKSRSPVNQLYRREIKINLANPKNRRYEEEEHVINNNLMEEKIITTTTKPQRTHKSTASLVPINPIQPEVQEEVLLNLFSCNNSGSVSSDSSESLVEFEDPKLKINEIYEKPIEERKVYTKPNNNNHNLMLEKRLAELEKKLRRLPELEIKNNILLEEKQMLIKQLLNMKQAPPPVVPVEKPTKMFRSIGSNSNESEFKRDVGTECKATTRDVGITIDEPREEIQKMETIITTLRDKLSEQTIILEKALQKPVTRDVAIMHVVDKVEKPKPEVRDVAINHRTEIDNKELIEKHTVITNTYIKEIDNLRIENARLSTALEDLIKKHSKHVITRGTHAPEQPIHYSVGTNTAKTATRDVQVMFTPKSRDVSLATDRFFHTRDVGLTCTLGNSEVEKQMMELLEIKAKYEQMIEEKLSQVKSYRDVAIVCNLDFKELRSVALGCHLIEEKQKRDVSMKCNLDEEFRSLRDVCIECNIDQKVLKDANIMVNTIPPPAHTKDFCSNVQFEDEAKLKLAMELAQLKKSQMKSTREIGVFVDQTSRLMEDQMKHQSCGMEQVQTVSRQMNTDTRGTKDFSVGTTLGDETHEFELKTYKKQLVEEEKHKKELFHVNTELRQRLDQLEEELKEEKTTIEFLNTKINSSSAKDFATTGVNTLTSQMKNQSCSNTDLTSLNEKIDLKIAAKVREPTCHKKETEYEEHKFTKIDLKNKTKDQLVTMNFVATGTAGEKFSESASFSTTTPIGQNQLCRTEMNIPIKHESSQPVGFTDDVMLVSEIASAETEAFKNCEKKPKGILKSSITEGQLQKKALTFGENKIVDNYEHMGSEQSLVEEHAEAADDEDEEFEEDPYETPITTIQNQTAESEDKHRIKTEHSNNLNDYDDYELQEQLMAESLNENIEDAKADSNESKNLRACDQQIDNNDM